MLGADQTVDGSALGPTQVSPDAPTPRDSQGGAAQTRNDASSGSTFPVSEWDRYEFSHVLGQGGMGTVYQAKDRRLDRDVALKFIRGGDPRLTLRLLQEARTQAQVDHPGICRVFEVGEVQGRAYIAMQLVAGVPLGAAAPRMSLHDKVRVARDVAVAMHEAHKLGILHRDIKPSNILVETDPDGHPRPIVTDFGLAREQSEERGLTETGALLGTPAYMSPEQARGGGRGLDRRADVYSLGATLYELLSGVPPFAGDSAVQVVLKVLGEEPAPLRARVPAVPVDLETIVAKCLRKDPGHRYDSARALADDLDRYIRGEPILGRKEGVGDRILRFARRHRALVATGMLAVSTLLVVGVASVGRVVRERDRAEAALLEARRAATGRLLAQARGALAHDPTLAVALLRALPPDFEEEVRAAQNIVAEAEAEGVARHAFLEPVGEWAEALFAPGGRSIVVAQRAELVEHRLSDGAVVGRIAANGISALRSSGDACCVIGMTTTRQVVWIDLVRRAARPLSGALPPALDVRAIGAAGGHAVLAHDDAVWRVDLEGRARVLPGGVRGHAIATSTASPRVAIAGHDEYVHVCSAVDDMCQKRWHHAGAKAVALSPNGAWLASGSDDGSVKIGPAHGSPAEAPRLFHTLRGAVTRLVFSADGRTLAAGGLSSEVALGSVDGGSAELLGGHHVRVDGMAFSPTDDVLATQAADGVVRVWFWKDGTVQTLRGSTASMNQDPCFSPDGTLLASVDGDGATRVWPVRRRGRLFRGHAIVAHGVAFVDGGTRMVTVGDDRTARSWDLSGASHRVLLRAEDRLFGIWTSPDGRWLVALGYDGTVYRWDLASGEMLALVGHEGRARAAAFLSDGLSAVTTGADHTLRVWDLDTGASRVVASTIAGLGFGSAYGRRDVVVPTVDDALDAVDLDSGATTRLASAVSSTPFRPAAAANGAVSACASEHEALFWGARDAKPVRYAVGEDACALHRLSADGRALYFPEGRTILRIDTETGVRTRFEGHRALIHGFNISADGRWLVTASPDHTARVWDLVSGAVAVFRSHEDGVLTALLSDDGATLGTASSDGTVWAGAVEPERFVAPTYEAIRARVGALTTGAVAPDGRVVTPQLDAIP